MTDSDRFPLLTDDGRALLKRLREHPHAPRYTAQCGNRLTAEYLRRVQAFEAEVRSSSVGWPAGGLPDWLSGFVEMCFRDVQFYREYGAQPAPALLAPARLADIPTLTRADLAREPWAFVPDTQPLDDLILYETSGTTGHPLIVLSHPVVSNSYFPLLKIALKKSGVTLTSGPGDVGCVLVGWQQHAYTYPSVTPLQGEAAHLKLNLHPDDWRDPADRGRFLDDLNPEIYTGDPLAFAELMALPLTTRPKALISTAMALLPGLRAQLEARFVCPVLDVYSMNESGPIAVLRPRMDAKEHEGVLLHHRIFVEILDETGRVCSPGERGEVTLTGGFNPFLPLLRYRTNDYAALEWRSGEPVLVGLEGRAPVVYRTVDGRKVNNLDVTGALKSFALPQYSVDQSADGSLHVRYRGLDSEADNIRAALLTLFGAQQSLTVERVESLGDKVIQYTSDFVTI